MRYILALLKGSSLSNTLNSREFPEKKTMGIILIPLISYTILISLISGCVSPQVVWYNEKMPLVEYYKPPKVLLNTEKSVAVIRYTQASILSDSKLKPIVDVSIDNYAIKMKIKWSETITETTTSKGSIRSTNPFDVFDMQGADTQNTSSTNRQIDKEGSAIIPFDEISNLYIIPPYVRVALKNKNIISIRTGNEYDAKKVADAIYSLMKSKGLDTMPRFGIELNDITPDQEKDVGINGGVVIAGIFANSAGKIASLKINDIIQKINNEPMMNVASMNTLLSGLRKGKIYIFELIRWEKISRKDVKKEILKINVIPF